MQDVIARGTGTAARIGRAAAGKTGTTSSSRDAWFVGFTPDIAAAAWVGNDDNAPLCPPGSSRHCITGGLIPAPIWRDAMKRVPPVARDFAIFREYVPEPEPADEPLTDDFATDTEATDTPATSSVQIELRDVDESENSGSRDPGHEDGIFRDDSAGQDSPYQLEE